MFKGGITGLFVIGLAACSGDNGKSSWSQEAGISLNEGHFAAPTLHNEGVQTGQLEVISSLTRRFAAEVNTTVYFKTGSASLSSDMRKTLDKQAAWITSHPKAKFRVYGHTDSVGSSAANRRLSQRRALAVVNYLARHGVSKNRLQAVISEGEHSPAVTSASAEQRNRRVVTEVSGLVAGATQMDGRYAAVVYENYVNSAAPTTGLTNGSVSTIGTGVSGN